MKLMQAAVIARRVLAEHGGIEIATVDMRPHAAPLNPDNAERAENAAAYNAMYAFTTMLNTISPESA